MKKLVFICTCIAFTYITATEAKERKYNTDLSVGTTLHNEDLGNGTYASLLSSYALGDLSTTFFDEMIKDDDNDGVSDKKDKCPGTPAGVMVDKTGCPLDKDIDGVADYKDKCPDIAGTVNTGGCPDKDTDGIADAEDRCPDVAGAEG